METKKQEGLRYNTGKNRLGLLPPNALKQIGEILTFGAEKYDPNNWKKGMPWSSVLDSLERHIEAFKSGIDYDDESGKLHLAHAGCNLMFLLEYYNLCPDRDDRTHQYLNQPKIGLDIDEVLADWVGAWMERFNFKERPTFWKFDHDMEKHLDEIKNDKNFWLSIKRKVEPKDLKFEPHCYITSRSIPIEWTKEWLKLNGFPAVPVYQIPNNESKVDVAKQSGCDWFVDDKFENFVELNKNGICCFLMDAPHNEKYEVGHKRILDLKDLKL
jgi:uncharacterized HAD superfamily protein